MTRDEALKKIKKCLALAASSNPHEAAAAMRQAQKLMEQFGLTTTDVSLADVAESKHRAPSAPLVRWEATLATLVAQAFGCDHYTSTRRVRSTPLGNSRIHRFFVFIGLHATAEVAGYAFEVLARQCAKDRRAHITSQPKNCKPKTKAARGDMYAEGWVRGVYDKLEKFARTEEQSALIAQHIRTHHPSLVEEKTKDRIKGKNVTAADFGQGFRAGKAANLHHGVAGGQRQALIGR